jgi:hypothetical protein
VPPNFRTAGKSGDLSASKQRPGHCNNQDPSKCRVTSPESSTGAGNTTNGHSKTSLTHLEGPGARTRIQSQLIFNQEAASKEAPPSTLNARYKANLLGCFRVPRDTPGYPIPGVPRGTPRYPEVPRDTPRIPAVTRGTPCSYHQTFWIAKSPTPACEIVVSWTKFRAEA